MMGDSVLPHDEVSLSPLTIPIRTRTVIDTTNTAIDDVDDLYDDDGSVVPAPGTFSEKFMEFVRFSISSESSGQPNMRAARGKKQRRFYLQDLFLIQRVEAELRWAFGLPKSRVRVWTPSTSLLQSLMEQQPAKQWVKGCPLALNGFQRMLVHSVATYLGLRSFSMCVRFIAIIT